MFIDLPPDQIDVNVHPTKAEVRFANPQLVYQTLLKGLKGAFGLSQVQSAAGTGVASGGLLGSSPREGPSATAVSEPLAPWATVDMVPAGSVEVLGQLFQTYIVARGPDGLLLVDQHTAHEKVLYERLQSQKKDRSSQGLLIPQTIELAPSEFSLLTEHAETISQLGLEYDAFGGRSIVLRAVPPQAHDRDCSVLLHWLLEDLEEAGRTPSAEELLKRLLSTMACHLAVKAGDWLELKVMERVVRELLALSDPRSCPHGRPTFVRYDEGELAKMFRRTWGLGKRECH